MALSYKQFCNLWGRGFLLAAIIADIAGLLIGGGEWVGMLYLCAAVLLGGSVAFLASGLLIRGDDAEV